MSVNPDGMADVDYSDFEYQTANLTVRAEEASDSTGTGSIIARAVANIEPLGGIGGLDNNEVAELAYLETRASLRYADDSGDQNVATTGFVRGVIGANLADTNDSFPQIRDTASDETVFSTTNIDSSNVNTSVNGGSEDRWFQPFFANSSTPFDDETNGPGGAGSNDSFHAEKDYRKLTGRGPVLDSSDDVSIVAGVDVGDTIVDAIGDITIHMIWDVAETSDAGRAFSVPMDD